MAQDTERFCVGACIDEDVCRLGLNRNEGPIERTMVIPAQWETVTGITCAVVGIGDEMGRCDQRRDVNAAKGALAAVPLDDLDLEPLLIRSSPRNYADWLLIFERIERLVVDFVAALDAHCGGAKLD